MIRPFDPLPALVHGRRSRQVAGVSLLIVVLLGISTRLVLITPTPPALAGAPTYVVPPATVVLARTPTPPGSPGGPTAGAPSLTPTALPSGTATDGTATAVSETATAISQTATAVAGGATWTALAGTETAIAATQTALVQTPSATRTAAPTSTPVPTQVPCLDTYEDDGVPAQARPIVVGEQQAHLLCPAGDADWLTFFGKAGKGYEVATKDLGMGVDTYLYLFASDAKTVLAYNDDAPGAHGPSQILFYPQADGWYLVMVKNQGDIGFPGARYTVRLDLVDLPTPTASPTTTTTPTAPPSPTLAPTSPPAPTWTPILLWTPGPGSPSPGPPQGVAGTPPPDSLLRPAGGGAASGGLPVFDAGPPDGMAPDALEPDDTFEQAAAVNVGAVYQHLNFVPAGPGSPDADFYVFRAKPGNCYSVTTGDLAAGLDTTILLWQAAATREGRKLLAQNDDARPHTADLSSFVRWCSPVDTLVVAEVHNYGMAPLTDPHGKTYSLAVQIDPPTPVPSPTPRPAAPISASGESGGNGGGGAVPPQPRVPPTPIPPPTALPTAPPLPTPRPAPPPTAPPAPSATPTSPGASPTPSATAAALATATPTPPTVAVDVIAYVGEPDAPGPLQGDGIVGWPVQLVDQRTNAVLQTTVTDENGHARLTWTWAGPVWIEMPILGWSHLVASPQDPALQAPLYARKESYSLPGVWP